MAPHTENSRNYVKMLKEMLAVKKKKAEMLAAKMLATKTEKEMLTTKKKMLAAKEKKMLTTRKKGMLALKKKMPTTRKRLATKTKGGDANYEEEVGHVS